MSAPAGITRVTLLKDLRLEWRSKDASNSMLFNRVRLQAD
jgi:hypothetical protein